MSASSRRVRRPRGTPTWIPVISIVAVVVVVGLLAYQAFGSSTWPRTPQHFVDLARTQLGNNQPQRALDTLAFALRDATGATKAEAVALEAEIRRMLLDVSELPKVVIARQEHDVLLSFVARYLRTGAARPAAREFVRQCDEWLQRHAELCRRHPDGKPLVRSVEEQRGRFVGLAALGEPDTAEDVVFAAQAMLRFTWRDYKGALRVLDAFLAAHPGDEAVSQQRAQILTDGEEWLRGKLRTVGVLIERGDLANAERDLELLQKWSELPQWSALIAEQRARLPKDR